MAQADTEMTERTGDHVVKLTREASELKAEHRVDLEWSNIGYSVTIDDPDKSRQKIEKQILRSCSGFARSGELLCILGASGAGKTTLLNALAQRQSTADGTITGDIFVNGHPVDRAVLKQHTAYIMQEDVLMDTMTPREALMFSAQLRLPSTMTNEERKQRVNTILRDLGLEKCADTAIGGDLMRGISGGERKRTSIGVELITNPSLLFVDEPTSGLDSYTAVTVIDKLRQLAKKGHTIIATIHQPSSEIFALFDKLMLMVNGRIFYCSSASEAVPYFAANGFQCPQYTNPADFFMRIMNQECKDPAVLGRLCEQYDQSIESQAKGNRGVGSRGSNADNDEDVDDRKDYQNDKARKSIAGYSSQSKLGELLPKDDRGGAGTCQQMNLLSQRAILNYLRLPLLTRVRLGQNIFLGLFAGLLYYNMGTDQRSIQDRNGVCFFITTSNFMSSLLSVLITFPAERALLMREVANNMYGLVPYVLSKFWSELPFQIVFPLIYSALSYWLIGFQTDADKFFIFVGSNILLVNVGQSIGLCLGAIVPSSEIALSIAPMIFIPLMLFAGFMLNTDNIPVWLTWLQWFSPFKYGFEILAENEYEGLTLSCSEGEARTVGSQQVCPITSGEQVLDSLAIDDVLTRNMLLLVGLFVFFRVVSLVFLRMKTRAPLC